jgi:hypothetical protein
LNADDMGNLMGVLPVTAALNNSFFASLKLIEKVGRGDYKPTDLALKFQQKWTFNKAEAPKVLTPAFIDTWFFDAVKQKVELSDGETTRADVIETLAGVANTDDSYATQYGFLLDWLEYVGLITTENGVVRLTDGQPGPASADAAPAPAAETGDTPPETPAAAVVTAPPAPVAARLSGAPIVSLTIEVVLTADDLSALAPEQITALFDGIGKVAAVKDALKKN